MATGTHRHATAESTLELDEVSAMLSADAVSGMWYTSAAQQLRRVEVAANTTRALTAEIRLLQEQNKNMKTGVQEALETRKSMWHALHL